jgi:hypothetical protein
MGRVGCMPLLGAPLVVSDSSVINYKLAALIEDGATPAHVEDCSG